MPTSNYGAFDVKIDNNDGTTTPLPTQTVKTYNITGAAALSDLTTDADGHIPAGTLSVSAGTAIRFSFSKTNGQCGYSEIVTT